MSLPAASQIAGNACRREGTHHARQDDRTQDDGPEAEYEGDYPGSRQQCHDTAAGEGSYQPDDQQSQRDRSSVGEKNHHGVPIPLPVGRGGPFRTNALQKYATKHPDQRNHDVRLNGEWLGPDTLPFGFQGFEQIFHLLGRAYGPEPAVLESHHALRVS